MPTDPGVPVEVARINRIEWRDMHMAKENNNAYADE
jgi:hypothetical protein